MYNEGMHRTTNSCFDVVYEMKERERETQQKWEDTNTRQTIEYGYDILKHTIRYNDEDEI